VELDAIGYEHYSKDGIDVKAGETARVSVLMTKTLPPLKPVEMGTLVIKSKSEFADVWVNGKYQDRTAKDGKYTIQLPPDKYEIQLKKNGFEDSPIQRMEIAAGTTSDLTFPPLKKSENAQRTPSEASIIIKSEPGARVRVNDEDVGTIEPNGQLGRKIQAGPYHVEVSMLGRTTFEKKDKTVADQRVIIVAKLPPLPPPPTQPPTPTTAVTPVPSTTPAVSTPVSAPSVNLSADKTSVEEGQSVVVTWETANAQEAFLNGKPADLFGRQSFNPTQGSDYVLLAKGKGGDYSKSVHVDVRKAQPPPSAVSDTDAIRRAIQQYRAALESENTVQLELIWPRIDPGSKKNWESYFHDAKSLRAEVKCLDDPIVKAPDKAELGCTQALTGTMKSGQVVSTKPKPVTFVLSKKEGSWLIDTVK
jgi:hypothetical protein